MKTVAIVQARMSSTRLPGKVLRKLPSNGAKVVLGYVIDRLKKSKLIDDIVIATSTGVEDDPIAIFATSQSVNIYRGSLTNVLDRFYNAATLHHADCIVRITADCPFIDPKVIDSVIESHHAQKADYSTIGLKRTYPIGLDVGVFNFPALEMAFHNAISDEDKEHVTPYFFKTNPQNFKINIQEAPKEYFRPELRLTLDTPDDYILLNDIAYQFKDDHDFDTLAILNYLDQKPWLAQINSRVQHNVIHTSLQSEIDEVSFYCQQKGLTRYLNHINLK